MNYNEIHIYLAGKKDYQTGLDLYLKFGTHANLKSLFTKKKMPEKLIYELKKLADKKPISKQKLNELMALRDEKLKEKINPEITSEPQKNTEAEKIDTLKLVKLQRMSSANWRLLSEQDPSEVKKLKLQFISIIEERRALHYSLTAYKTDEERLIIATRILRIKNELDEIDHSLMQFQSTGALPLLKFQKTEDITDRALLQKKLENLKIYERRYRKKEDKKSKWEEIKKKIELINKKLAIQ